MASLASWILIACGLALVLIGGFFLAVRPPLLPEDARFMGSTLDDIVEAVPGLTSWLRHVFWVLGGFIAATGVLVVYVASAGEPTRDAGALAVLAVAGVTSLGWMSVVNFMIGSDFKWALLALDGIWLFGLALAVAAP